MPRVRKPVVELAPDGTVAERWDSMYDLTRQYGRDRFFFRKSCNTGILYLGRRFMWADDYERAVAEGRTSELAYGRQSHTPVIYRRRVAYTYDYRGVDDDRLVFLFKGATVGMLRLVFDLLSGSANGLITGYDIRQGHDVVRLWRHCYERLEVWVEGFNPRIASVADILTILQARLKTMAGGDVDFYLIDDFLNLTDRDTKAVARAWESVSPAPVRGQAAKKKQRKKKTADQPESANNNKEEQNQEKMPKMYVRVPGYVAGFFRGRSDDRQLTEFDPYEFPDHDDLMLFMEHHLRFIPEQNQNVYCFSERAFNHILHGKQPSGGQQILDRDPTEWPTIKEFCTLTGKFVTDKQESADYLCIAIPKEILDGGRLLRTNGSFALPKKEAEKFVSYLRQDFKREFEAFCEVDEMVCLENGINRSDVDRMERFFANYNMPVSVDQKDRESLRKLMFRIRKRKNVQPYLRKKLDTFVQHISDDDLKKAERREKKIERMKGRTKRSEK